MTSTIEGAREYAKLWAREKAKDPDYRAKAAARRKELRALDPARAEADRAIAKKHRENWSDEKKAKKREAHTAYIRKRRAEDPVFAEKQRDAGRKITVAQTAKPTWAGYAVARKKSECGRRGIAFDITVEDIPIPDVCPFTLRPIVFGPGLDRDGPSIDRIRPHEGYVKGNVRIISWYANALRQDCTDPAVFERLALDARDIAANSYQEPPLARKG